MNMVKRSTLKKTINALKMLTVWLIIVAMLAEAPLALYASVQQGGIGAELHEVQDELELSYIDNEYSPANDAQELQEYLPAVNPVVHLEASLLSLEDERYKLVYQLEQLDMVQAEPNVDAINQQLIVLANRQFVLHQEINAQGGTASTDELEAELTDVTSQLAEMSIQLEGLSASNDNESAEERNDLLTRLNIVEELIQNTNYEIYQILNGYDETLDNKYDEYFNNNGEDTSLVFQYSFTGLITSEETGSPLYNATVSLIKGETVVASTSTDYYGWYIIDAASFTADELNQLYITASHHGYQSTYINVLGFINSLNLYEDNTDLVIDFNLTHPEVVYSASLDISGAVTSDGTSLEGASVELIIGDEVFVVYTDEQGLYQIALPLQDDEAHQYTIGLLSGATLSASLAGYETASINLEDYVHYIEYGAITINFALEPLIVIEGMALVEGTVTLDEAPVYGARIYFYLNEDELEDIYYVAITDTYGRFNISLPAYVDTSYTVVAVYATEGEDADTELEVNFGSSVSLVDVLGGGSFASRAASPTIELLVNAYDELELELELEWMGIRAASIVEISNSAQLSAFLMGQGEGDNLSTFVLTQNINMAGMGPFQGRGYVNGIPFMGTFDGGGFQIQNLALVPRDASELPETPGHNDFGFIRVMGSGAVRNLTLATITYTDSAVLATWNAAVGSIGLLVGRVTSGSTATIENVTVTGGTATITGVRPYTNKRFGGLVGTAGTGSTINMSNVNVNFTVNFNVTGTGAAVGTRAIPAVGGLVGESAGNVNLRGTGNTVNLVTSIGGAGVARTITNAGGAVGQLTSAATASEINNLTVTGTIAGTATTGGIVGRSLANGLTINDSTTNFTTNTTSTVAGGFVGIANAATINNGRNTGALNIGGGTAGGFIGQHTGPAVNSIDIRNSTNTGNITATTFAGGFVGSGRSMTISGTADAPSVNSGIVISAGHRGGFVGFATAATTFANVTNSGAVSQSGTSATAGNTGIGGIIGSQNSGAVTLTNARNTANFSSASGRIGGLVGRSAGAVTITDGSNTGNLTVNGGTTGTAAARRGRINGAGGLLGHGTSSITIVGGSNQGIIRGNGQGGAGGAVGQAGTAGSTSITGFVNSGTVASLGSNQRHAGGLIGRAGNALTIRNSVNHAIVENHHATGAADGGASGGAGQLHSAGGLVGLASNVLIVSDSHNHGAVRQRGVTGTTAGTIRLGGIAAVTMSRVEMTNVSNSGDLSSARRVNTVAHSMGGIIGRMQWPTLASNRTAFLTNVTNTGHIGTDAAGTANNDTGIAGGIIGHSTHRTGARGLNLNNVQNHGNVVGRRVAGGLIGFNDTLNTSINNSMNFGLVRTTENAASARERTAAGGIIGRSARNNLTVMNSGNEGTVHGASGATTSSNNAASSNNSGVAGIVGHIDRGTNNRILTSYNSGSIQGPTSSTGGIIGGIRRSGTTLIQDVYNIGSVHSRQAGTSGNGILGHRRRAVGNITFRRVFNAGNVGGDPIFRAVNTAGSGTRDTAADRTRRMVYDQVFFDSTTHTGRAPITFPGSHRGVNTAILTAGTMTVFNSGAWLTYGWVDNLLAGLDPWWESYPFLAWQTGGQLPSHPTLGTGSNYFMHRIEPGADHLRTTAGTVTVDFLPNHSDEVLHPNGRVVNNFVRVFQPYIARTDANHAARAHQQAGSSVTTASRPANSRTSVGLISRNAVVGFGENELFVNVTVFGMDRISENLVHWATIAIDGVVQDTSLTAGMLHMDEIQVGQVLSVVDALGYAVPAYHIVTQEDVDNWHNLGRWIIRIPLDRIPIPYLRVEVRNDTPEEEIPPLLLPARNPWARRTRADEPTVNFVGNSPAAAQFNANGSMWYDFLEGSGDHFSVDQISLHFDHIRNPEITPSADNPYIVWLRVDDRIINVTRPLRAAWHEPTEEDAIERLIPHANGDNWRAEFRNPTDPGTAWVAAGLNLLAGTVNLDTEVRIIPEPGRLITSGGRAQSFRPSGWYTLEDIAEWTEADDPVILNYTVILDAEYHLTVAVVEAHELIPGSDEWHYIYLGDTDFNTTLTLEADMGGDEADLIPQTQAPSNSGIYPGVRVLDGELLIATADGFIDVEQPADVPDIFDSEYSHERTYIYMQRANLGRIYGFVFDARIHDNPANAAFRLAGATVVVLDSSGNRVSFYNSAGQLVNYVTSDANGFYEVFGLEAGTYTVFASHNNIGALSVPNPVTLIEDAYGNVTNERADFFIDLEDPDNGFMVFVNVRTASGENISNQASAILRYPSGEPRFGAYTSPFISIPANAGNLSWIDTGVVTVDLAGFVPVEVYVRDGRRGPGYIFIDVVLLQVVEDLEVYVYFRPSPGADLILVSTAWLQYNGSYITTRPGAPNDVPGAFLIDVATVGSILRAGAPGFNTVERPLEATEALSGRVVIMLTETVPVDLTVTVVDATNSQTITTAWMTQPSMAANNTGVFTVSGARFDDTLAADAHGFAANNIRVSFADLASRTATIPLTRVETSLQVRVQTAGGTLIPTATLTYNGTAITGSGGLFTIPNAIVGGTMVAVADGFSSRTQTVVYTDFNRGYAIIVLDGNVPVQVTVRVTDSAGAVLPTATLTNARLNPSPTTPGYFTVMVAGDDIGELLRAGAPGFNYVDRDIRFTDLQTPRVIEIRLGRDTGGYREETVTVRVVRDSDGALIPTARLTGVPNITAVGNGTFTLRVDGSNLGNTLRAEAAGFTHRDRTLIAQDLAAPREIEIRLVGDQAINLTVYVVQQITEPLVPLTIARLTRNGTPAPVPVAGRPGVWTVAVTGDQINSTTLTGDASGFAAVPRPITFADLHYSQTASRPVVIELDSDWTTSIFFRIVDSDGNPIPTALLHHVTATNTPLPVVTNGRSNHWRSDVVGSLVGSTFTASAPGFNSNTYELTLEGLEMYGRGYTTIVLGRNTTGYNDVDVQVRVYRYVAGGNNVLLPSATVEWPAGTVTPTVGGLLTLSLNGSHNGQPITVRAAGFRPYTHNITLFDLHNGVITVVLGGTNGYEPVDMTVLVANAATPAVALAQSNLVHSGGVAVGGSNGNFTVRLDGRHIGTTLNASHNLFAPFNHPVTPQDLAAGHVLITLLEGAPQTFIVNVVDSAAPNRHIPTATLVSAGGAQVTRTGDGIFEVTATAAAVNTMLTAGANGFNSVNRSIQNTYFGGEITIQLGRLGEGYNDINVNVRVYRYVAGGANVLLPTATLTGVDRVTSRNDGTFAVTINGSYVGRGLTASAAGFRPYTRVISFFDLDGRDIVIVLGGENGYELVDVRVTVSSENAALNPMEYAQLILPAGATIVSVVSHGVWDVRMSGEHVGQVITARAPGHEDARHDITVENLRDRAINVTLREGEATLVVVRVVDSNTPANVIPTATVSLLGDYLMQTDGEFQLLMTAAMVGHDLRAWAPGFRPVYHELVIEYFETGIIYIVLGSDGQGYDDIALTVEVRRESDRLLIETAILTGVSRIVNNNDGTFTLTVDGRDAGRLLEASARGFSDNEHRLTHHDIAAAYTNDTPIVIYLAGDQPVNLTVYVVQQITAPLIPLTIARLTRNGTPAPVPVAGRPGVWTVAVTGDQINSTTLTGDASGFAAVPRPITFADLHYSQTASRPVVIELDSDWTTSIFFRIVDSDGNPIPTALLHHVTATNTPLPVVTNGRSNHWRSEVVGSLVGSTFTASAPGFNSNTYELTLQGLEMYGRGYTTIVLGRSTTGYNDVDVQVRVYRYVAGGNNVLLPSATVEWPAGTVTPTVGGLLTLSLNGSHNGQPITVRAAGFRPYTHNITLFDLHNGVITVVLGGTNGYEYVDVNILVANFTTPTVPLTISTLSTDSGIAITGANGLFGVRVSGRHIGAEFVGRAIGFADNSGWITPEVLAASSMTILLAEGEPVYLTVNVVDSNMRPIPTATLTFPGANVVHQGNGVFRVRTTAALIDRYMIADAYGFAPVNRRKLAEYLALEYITIQLGRLGQGYDDVDVNVRVYRYVAGGANVLLPTATLTGVDRITSHNDGRFTVTINGSYVSRSLTASASGFRPNTHEISFFDLDGRDIVIVLGGENGYELVDVRVTVSSENAAINPMQYAQLILPTGATIISVVSPGVWDVRMSGEHVGQVITARAPGHEDARHDITVENLRDREINITLREGEATLVVVRVLDSNNTLVPTATVSLLGDYLMETDGEFQLLMTAAMVGHDLRAWAPGFRAVYHELVIEYFETGVVYIVLGRDGQGYENVNMEARVYRMVDGERVLIPTAILTGVANITNNNDGTFNFILDGSSVGTTLTASAIGFASRNHVVTFEDLYEGVISFVLEHIYIETLEAHVVRNVYNDAGNVIGTTLVTTATLRRGDYYFTIVGSYGAGSFDLSGLVRVDDFLAANATGFVGRTHRITPEEAAEGLVVINLSYTDDGGCGYEIIEELTVRVVNAAGILISTATLTLRGEVVVGNTDGTFNLNELAYINDVLQASAPGYDTVTHVITPEDADAGEITITLPGQGPQQPPIPPLPPTPHEPAVDTPPSNLIPFTPRTRVEAVKDEIPEPDLSHIETTRHAYIIGFSDGTVRPHANITRAEVTTIFFRLITDQHRADIWSQTNTFDDVHAERWFNNPISTMQRGGLFAGIPLGDNFNPNQAITRAEFAAMVVNYLGLGNVQLTDNAFTDIEGHWASNAINVAHQQGWVRGFGDGTFRPNQTITRAEAAALINRALGRLPQSPDDLLAGMVTFTDNMHVNTWYYLYIQSAANSYYHVMHADEIHETWTELITPRNWRSLERPYSQPHHIFN